MSKSPRQLAADTNVGLAQVIFTEIVSFAPAPRISCAYNEL